MIERIDIRMLGVLRVRLGERTITRFRTQKTAALLAYLAYHRHRSQTREHLVDLFWPESEPDSGRHSLSLALSSLRSQLEPPGVTAGSVIVADRWSVELNPEAFDTDVHRLETALRRAAQAPEENERVECLRSALAEYGGKLLPALFEDWVFPEQERLSARFIQATKQLIAVLERRGDLSGALEWARRAVQEEPQQEETHAELIRLLAAAGEGAAALRQYRETERMLQEEFGEAPSQALNRLVRDIEASLSGEPRPGGLPAPVRAARVPAPRHPMGTVTFLLTDVEGSTALWQRAGDEYVRAFQEHQRLLRREFQRHGGYEFKEAGDAFLCAFSTAGDALACAVAGQRALCGHEWPVNLGPIRVRMALCSGDAEYEDGDYRGLVLHRASRMLSAAHGEQTLCAEATSSLLRRDLETEVSLRDLGFFRLRDVEAPERLFQVDFAGCARREFPPLRAERAHTGSIPLQFTRFFGREEELATLQAWLRDGETRLVTVTGPGGTGKTRLAVEAAQRLLDQFSGAVWFVGLGELTDARLLPETILGALHVQADPGVAPLEQVVQALGVRPTLLILDNMEQLVNVNQGHDGGELVQTLLESTPALHCLVTSRQVLGLPGERHFTVQPLPTPGDGGSPERLGVYESVRLFVDRAQAVKPDFQVTNSNAPAVAELVTRLEGIPLAIELAAARAQVLTPAQMLQQLAAAHGGRFDLLVSRRRGGAERQRALRATVDWSYQLLSPALRRFFSLLAVFRGGFTAESAEAVCDDPLALDHLAQLREASLVVTNETTEGIRFRMLETLREFARDQAGEALAGTTERHRDYFLRYAEEAEAELRGENQASWLARLEQEHDNLRAALETAGPEAALRFARALWYFWSIRGHHAEGRRKLHRCLEDRGDAGAGLLAPVLTGAGALAHDQSDFIAARTHLQEAVSLSRAAEEDRALAYSLNCLANLHLDEGEPEDAMPLYQEALGLYRTTGDHRGASIVLSNLGVLHQARGERERAVELLSESVRLKRRLGNKYGLANSLESLGNLECDDGRLEKARALYDEALTLRQELGHRLGVAMSLNNLGHLALRRGDLADARSRLSESLPIFESVGEMRGYTECLAGLALLAAAQERGEFGVRLLDLAEGVRRRHAMSPSEREVAAARDVEPFRKGQASDEELELAEITAIALGRGRNEVAA